MRRIDTTAQFKKKLTKFGKNHPELLGDIRKTMKSLATDPVSRKFRAHKLKGSLVRSWSVSINYQYRIIYEFSEHVIVFHTIGSHDQVY